MINEQGIYDLLFYSNRYIIHQTLISLFFEDVFADA